MTLPFLYPPLHRASIEFRWRREDAWELIQRATARTPGRRRPVFEDQGPKPGLVPPRGPSQTPDGDSVTDPVEPGAPGVHTHPINDADHMSLLIEDGPSAVSRVHGGVDLDFLAEVDLAEDSRRERGLGLSLHHDFAGKSDDGDALLLANFFRVGLDGLDDRHVVKWIDPKRSRVHLAGDHEDLHRKRAVRIGEGGAQKDGPSGPPFAP